MYHLIANTGIQFIVNELECNPEETLSLPNGKTLKYTFTEKIDLIDGVKRFDLLYYHNEAGHYIPVSELRSEGHEDALLRRANGREEIDFMGMYKVSPSADMSQFTAVSENDEDLYNMNSLMSMRVRHEEKGVVPAFDLLLGKWLPMPMFKKEVDGVTGFPFPMGWCRLKIDEIGEGERKGMKRYRFTWAFDTETAFDEFNVLRPQVWPQQPSDEEYCLCNKADTLLDYLSSDEEFHTFNDYVATVMGIDPKKADSMKHKAFYIYLVNFLRLTGVAPEVKLHYTPEAEDGNDRRSIPVDLVLDIGNSRTCGILFEKGQFTSGTMMALRNLTHPHKEYENKSFDMRVVFRKADFGNDLVLEEDIFNWKSFVRVGDEAKDLVYRSLEDAGLTATTTNYSSPKRYLWDLKPFDGNWENMVTEDDPLNVRFVNDIYIPGLSERFDARGEFKGENAEDGEIDLGASITESHHHFSRSSLMTFAFLEIFNQAIMQINSVKYRDKWGDIDSKRYLRTVIITCPTAMPKKEQMRLRQCAVDAFKALTLTNPLLKMPLILPDAEELKKGTTWTYDEASCCQLTYLCGEIAQRYSGEIRKFFDLKGHVRKHLADEGYEGKALTIGTIDIGAGTTDLMVCAYECIGEQNCGIKPVPLFWDSFYIAGDDILRNLVQNFVIEGKNHHRPDLGNITSALTCRILAITNDELRALPCAKDNVVYAGKINEIVRTEDEDQRATRLKALASNLIHDFFGKDSSMMGYKDRRCRLDFNTQISVPLAQKMMELSRLRRPSRLYTFDELFEEMKPSGYLLDYFARHFGFRFEELSWRYDPDEVNAVIRASVEPLMKQLAQVLHALKCDIIVLAGRPTSLDAVTELFIKYLPTTPDRLVRLNDYRVGSWFPTADGRGYFYDQKAMVAVGAMVGYLASSKGLKDLSIDFRRMIKDMKSTANYLGVYNSRREKVEKTMISPEQSVATITMSDFPTYIGCRQLDSPIYQARPLYAIYNHSPRNTIKVTLTRVFQEDPEELVLEDAMDTEGNTLGRKEVELVMQTLVEGGCHWLDKGEFELTI